jgi:hypothetical protein
MTADARCRTTSQGLASATASAAHKRRLPMPLLSASRLPRHPHVFQQHKLQSLSHPLSHPLGHPLSHPLSHPLGHPLSHPLGHPHDIPILANPQELQSLGHPHELQTHKHRRWYQSPRPPRPQPRRVLPRWHHLICRHWYLPNRLPISPPLVLQRHLSHSRPPSPRGLSLRFL